MYQSLDKHHDANVTDSSSDAMMSCSKRIEGAPIYPDTDTPLDGYAFSGSLLTLDEISSCTYLSSADGIDICINEKVKLDSQLKQIRAEKHEEHCKLVANSSGYHKYLIKSYASNTIDRGISISKTIHLPPQDTNINRNYKENTLLIVSDSIMNQLDQKRLTRHGVNVNVWVFSGSMIEDMYSYLIPLLKRKPRYILLHIGTNDAPFKSSNQITNEILLLKKFINDSHQEIAVIFSLPIMRTDNGTANKILNQHAYELCQLNVHVLDNSNIHKEHLGKNGLHLNRRGTGRLALNIMSLISRL